MTIAEKILAYRAEKNLSMQKFAQLCNVSIQTIYNIEKRNTNPSRFTLAKIKKVLESK